MEPNEVEMLIELLLEATAGDKTGPKGSLSG
jgi:hypothetical protein